MIPAPALPPGRALRLPGRGTTFVRELPGPPGAPTIVLLHGWTVTSDLNWFTSYATLGEHFRVVAVDHRGHGRGIRTRRPFRLEDCADDAVFVADALGIDRFVPVGYSMGGPVAMLAWRRHRHRVAGLVLCATARNFRGSVRNRVEFPLFTPVSLATRLAPGSTDRRLFEWLIDQRVADRDYHPWVIGEIKSGDPRLLLDAGRAIGRFDAAPWVGEVDVPTSVVVLSDDTIVPTRRQEKLAAALPGAEVWRLDGDHDLCLTDADPFVSALIDACHHAWRR